MSQLPPEAMINLPQRPLAIQSKAVRRPGIEIFAAVFLLALAIALTIWQAPGILRDVSIKSNPVYTEEFELQKGECKTQRVVFTDCAAEFRYVANDEIHSADVSFMFFDAGGDDYYVDVVYDADNPENATLSLGIEKFWNRVIMWGLFAGILYGLAIWTLIRTIGGFRTAGTLSKPGQVRQVGVKITNVSGNKRVQNFQYRLVNDEFGSQKKHSTVFGKNSNPLIWHNPMGENLGIAVIHEGSPVPVLLDQELQRLNLTEAERAAAFGGPSQGY